MFTAKVAYMVVAELPKDFDDVIDYNVYTDGEDGAYYEIAIHENNVSDVVDRFLDWGFIHTEQEADELREEVNYIMLWVPA